MQVCSCCLMWTAGACVRLPGGKQVRLQSFPAESYDHVGRVRVCVYGVCAGLAKQEKCIKGQRGFLCQWRDPRGSMWARERSYERERGSCERERAEKKWKEKSTEWRLFSGCRVFCRYSLLSGYTVWRWLIVGLIVAPQTKRSSQDILPENWRPLAVSWERDTSADCHGKRLWLRPRSKRGVSCWPKESSAEARVKGAQRTSLFSEEKEEIRHLSACWTPR